LDFTHSAARSRLMKWMNTHERYNAISLDRTSSGARNCTYQPRALQRICHHCPRARNADIAVFVRARCTISVERCCIVLHKCASQAAQDHHYGQVCRAMDYQYQFEKCRDLDTWYMAWRMKRSSARAWIQYMNGLMMACSCCPHGTASLRNKRTNPNLLCLSRLHVACQSPTRPESAVLLLFADRRYTRTSSDP
jgi:hypothetical protein